MTLTIDNTSGLGTYALLGLNTNYDQYKILRYSVCFVPKYTESTYDTTYNVPNVTWYQDSDDAVMPSSLNTVMSRPNSITQKLNKKVFLTRKFPCVRSAVHRSGDPALSSALYGYTIRKSPWLDMSMSDIPHYGIKGVIQGDATGAPYVLPVDIRITVDYLMKNPL